MLSPVWGSPLLADGKIFVGDEDGDVRMFRLSPRLEVLGENNMGGPVQTTPAAVDGVLYIATRNHLFAIGKDPRDPRRGIEGILPQSPFLPVGRTTLPVSRNGKPRPSSSARLTRDAPAAVGPKLHVNGGGAAGQTDHGRAAGARRQRPSPQPTSPPFLPRRAEPTRKRTRPAGANATSPRHTR